MFQYNCEQCLLVVHATIINNDEIPVMGSQCSSDGYRSSLRDSCHRSDPPSNSTDPRQCRVRRAIHEHRHAHKMSDTSSYRIVHLQLSQTITSYRLQHTIRISLHLARYQSTIAQRYLQVSLKPFSLPFL